MITTITQKGRPRIHDTPYTLKSNTFDIEDFALMPDEITIEWSRRTDTTNQTLAIGRDTYEQWLLQHNKLQWHLDLSEAWQASGTLQLEQYWQDVSYQDKLRDMKTFFTSRKQVVGR